MNDNITEHNGNSALAIVNIYRNMAIGFSAVFLVLMLIVAIVGSYFYSRVSRANEYELQETITSLLANSINRISFAGKYHARQFIETIAASQPRIAYINIINKDGEVIASSISMESSLHSIFEQDINIVDVKHVLAKHETVFNDILRGDQSIRQIAMPYKSGYQNKDTGVIFVGISMNEINRAEMMSHILLASLVLVLSFMSVGATLLLSKWLASPVISQALQFKQILDNIPLFLCISDRDGEKSVSSSSFVSLAMDNPNILGSEIENVFKINSQIEREVTYNVAGSQLILQVISFPILRDSRGFPLLVCSIAMNVTERKQAENELSYLRNYLSNVIDSMPSILVGVDVDNTIIHWNKTAEIKTGISADTAYGKSFIDLFPHMSSDIDKISLSIKSREIMYEQKRLRFSEASTCYEDVTIYPLVANGVQGAVIRIDDVTDKVKMEEMMVQSEKMLSMGGLAAGMAHEINNPLAGMMQTADVLLNRLVNIQNIPANLKAVEDAGITAEALNSFLEARDIPRMVNTIKTSGLRAAAIVNNMLGFVRKSDNGKCFNDLADLLDKTLVLAVTDYDFKKKYDFKLVNIETDYEENLPRVFCEANKIQQVFLNLLRNSAQAMFEAKIDFPLIVIRMSYDQITKIICIEFEDNGPGINEESCLRVFEPFYTTKPAGFGTGLGLSVSYFIVTEVHGGSMLVESRLGEGARFIIKLPVSWSDA